MKKIAILTCSNAGLDYLDYPKDIRILRSVIHFGTDESYDDFVDIDAKTFYERIANDPNDIPKTSYVSPGKMIEIFEELEAEGYEEALVITISSQLSGLFEAVKRVASEVKIKVTAFDSKTLAYSEAYMVLEAHRMAEEGLSVKDIVAHLETIRDNDTVYFAVDTLLYLVKNGRLSKLQGTLGTMLQLKPLLVLGDDGKVASLEKIRTTHKAQQRVLEKYIEETKDLNVLTFISHAHNDNAAEWFKSEIQKVFPNRDVIVAPL
ncbi:MAG: DegV family protein, partial [Acholeplasmataceae bacterium]|nr:DegV family protein [Acholeplasmataceae bacterium]